MVMIMLFVGFSMLLLLTGITATVTLKIVKQQQHRDGGAERDSRRTAFKSVRKGERTS